MRPPQKPGRSRQDYGTPPEFIRAVEERFGLIDFDLAATASNCVAMFYGPEHDSLAQDWLGLMGNLWLNPPFGRQGVWASKCRESMGPGRRILLLTPASVGSRWFADHVWGHALVLALSPRLTFVGETHPYPSDLILSVYDPEMERGFAPWRWRT